MRKAKRNWNTAVRQAHQPDRMENKDMPGKSLLSRSAAKVKSSVACLAWKFKTYSEKAFRPGKPRWIHLIEAVNRNDE